MKITYLGQAGLMFESAGKVILVDPYLSDSVAKVEPQNHRRVQVDEKFLSVKPNVIIITHNHLDHFDKQTLDNYLTENSGVLVLSPLSVWSEIRKYGGNNRYVLFNAKTCWTENGITFRAVKAEHSDKDAIGVIIGIEGKKYYITGDTLYNEKVISTVKKEKLEAVFLPVNGVGNNMNMTDAENFVKKLKVKKVVPVHIGLFDDLNAKDFNCKKKVVATIYKEIIL